MADNAILVVILAIIVVACCTPVVIGVLVSRHLKKTNPNSELLKAQTPTDLLFAAIVVLILFAGTVIGELAPEGMLGSFQYKPFGVIAGFFVFFIAAFVAAFVFGVFRYFLRKHSERDDA